MGRKFFAIKLQESFHDVSERAFLIFIDKFFEKGAIKQIKVVCTGFIDFYVETTRLLSFAQYNPYNTIMAKQMQGTI